MRTSLHLITIHLVIIQFDKNPLVHRHNRVRVQLHFTQLYSSYLKDQRAGQTNRHPSSQAVIHLPTTFQPPTVRKGDDDGDCDNDIKMKPSHWTGGYFGEVKPASRGTETPKFLR